MKAQLRILSGARAGQVDAFQKAYIALGRHPLADVRFDADLDLDVSAQHAALIRQGNTFVVRDLGSTNGTFVNSRRISGDVSLEDGDVIRLGARGPSLEFHALDVHRADEVSTAVQESARRASAPRDQFRALTPPPRSATDARIAAVVAHQTRGLRRATKLLIALLIATGGAFAWIQWHGSQDARELASLQARADSLSRAARDLATRFHTELESVREALRASEAETQRLRRELAAASPAGDPAAVAQLRAALDAAELRQRGLAGVARVDYRAISQRNADAIAIVVVKFSESEIFSGTAFAVDSQGTMITNKHVLTGDGGARRPLGIAVKFAGSAQWFRGRVIGTSDVADIGVLAVDVHGGTPRIAGFAPDSPGPERGDPVAILGYPLGEDLPMESHGRAAIADPTLTVGTVSKVLHDLVQVDGYGAPGSSGSPIFDDDGRVVAVLYGGNRESQGRIIYAVPASQVTAYLRQVAAMR